MSDCYYDAAGCLVCPEQAAQEYIPNHVEQRAVIGWNAGANSIDTNDGGLRVYFTQPLDVVGIILGLKGSRKQQTIPSLIEHGWYFQKVAGINIAQPIERGVPCGTITTNRTDATVFEIRRSSTGSVTYLVDDIKVWTSIFHSEGAKVVNCCMFASGDTAEGGTAIEGGAGGGGSTPPTTTELSSSVPASLAGMDSTSDATLTVTLT